MKEETILKLVIEKAQVNGWYPDTEFKIIHYDGNDTKSIPLTSHATIAGWTEPLQIAGSTGWNPAHRVERWDSALHARVGAGVGGGVSGCEFVHGV